MDDNIISVNVPNIISIGVIVALWMVVGAFWHKSRSNKSNPNIQSGAVFANG